MAAVDGCTVTACEQSPCLNIAGWQGWIVVVAAAIALVVMAGDWVGPDLVFTTVIGFFMAARILPVNDAGRNYGNTGLLTVIKLYIVAEGIYQTGGLEWVMTKVGCQCVWPELQTGPVSSMMIPCMPVVLSFVSC
jgi:hypothetical protein